VKFIVLEIYSLASNFEIFLIAMRSQTEVSIGEEGNS
jgi:hypothetical protein